MNPVGDRETSWRRYARLTVGTPSLKRLLIYELILGVFGGMPGSLGYAARRRTYRALFKRLGHQVIIGRNVTLRGTSSIALGNGVALDDNLVLDARGRNASITVEDGVVISRNTIVRARDAAIRIGRGSFVGANCLLAADSRIDIGCEVLISPYTYVVAGGNHCFGDPTTPIVKQGIDRRGGVVIEDDVWIGAQTIVMDVTTIGTGSVIGAQSLVKTSIGARSIAWGSPARVHRTR